jgi:two-component system cell cycle sensor histidine kinase/response regulator CckA
MNSISKENAASEAKLRILVIDDEKNILELISDVLESAGYEVYVAENGRKGIEVFKQFSNDIDLVVLDIVMPEVGGVECFHEIRSIRADIKILLTSGYNKSEINEELIRDGIQAYLPKPFNLTDFLNTVEAVLS